MLTAKSGEKGISAPFPEGKSFSFLLKCREMQGVTN